MLCEKCSNIVLRPDPRNDDWLLYQLHDTLRLLRLSAQSCHLCRHICYKFDLDNADWALRFDDASPICITYKLPKFEHEGEGPFKFDLSLFGVYTLNSLGNPCGDKLIALDETCFGM